MGLTPNPLAGQPQPVNVSAMGGGGMPSLPPPSPQPVVQQVQPDPETVHSALIGKAFKALSGQNTQYSIDPKTGQTIQTQTPNTPGQFFRNVVASALIGGAMGADKARQNEGSGLAAAAQGGQAVMTRDQQLNQQRIEQAQQQYQNQLRASQEQREQATANREEAEAPLREQMLKAQTASYNASVARDTVDTQNKDFAFHNEVSTSGQAKAKAIFGDNGIDPFKEGLSETEADAFLKDNPGAASKYLAIPTGVKQSLDKNGQPVWENTFSLYDNSVPSAVTPNWLATPEMQALKTEQPDYFKVLQQKAEAGGTVTPEQRTSILTNAKQAYTQQQARQKDILETQHEQALIDEAKAHINEYKASTAKIYADRKDQEFGKSSLEAVLAGNNGVDAKGVPKPITPKQYAAALPILQDNAKNAHDNWVAAISAAKDETDEKGPLHQQAVDAGVAAAEAQGVVRGIIQRASGQPTGNTTQTGPPQITKPNANIAPTRYDAGLVQNGVNLALTMPKDQAFKLIDEAPNLSDTEKETIKLKVKNQLDNPSAPLNTINASQR